MFKILITRMKHPPDKELRFLEAHDYMKLLQRLNSSENTSRKGITSDKVTEQKTVSVKPNAQVIKALRETGDINLENIPANVLTKRKRIDALYLLDKDVAKEFASMIAEDVAKTRAFVLEMNPGIGFLTEELIQAGVAHIHLYENNPDFVQSLKPLLQKYPNHLELRLQNFVRMRNLEYVDKKTNTKKMEYIFRGIEKRKWEDEPSMCMIGALPKMEFFFHLQLSITNQYFSDYGRIVLYVAIPPSMTMSFIDTTEYPVFHKAKNIHLQTLFNYKQLGTLPRKAFFPWVPDKQPRKRNLKYYQDDSRLMDIVKLESNPDLYTGDFTQHDSLLFFYFLCIHMRRRDARIIPALEQWIPGCGPRLIKRNFNIYSEFRELSAPLLLDLFKTFKSWPEYETSPFIGFVEAIITQRMD